MDFSDFELTRDAVFIQLKHPQNNRPLFDQHEVDGEMVDNPEAPVGVEVYGADSDVFKKHRRKLTDKAIEARAKRKTLASEEIDDDAEKTLAACIKSLVRISYKGRPLVAPQDNLTFVRELPSFAEQVDEAMADRTLFMPALAKS